MLSIGWVIFWKCVVVGVWVGIVAAWQGYRKKRQQEGLPLRQDPRTGIYRVSDWTAKVDRTAIWLRNAAWFSIFALWTLFGGIYLWGGKPALTEFLMEWLFY